MGQGERSYPQSRLMCITLDALHTIAARVYNYVGTDVPMRYAAPAQLATLPGLRTPRDELPSPRKQVGRGALCLRAIRTKCVILRAEC